MIRKHSVAVSQPYKEASIAATIIRCVCGNPDSHFGEVCPQGNPVDMGIISYYHRNPLRRWGWMLKNALKGRSK